MFLSGAVGEQKQLEEKEYWTYIHQLAEDIASDQ